MSFEKFEPSTAVSAGDELDDLQKLIMRVEAERPRAREVRDDLRELHSVLDELVALRKAADLSQSDVAKVMNVKQPTVSQFENESSDPKVSTLQRYARAVGTRLRMSVGGPALSWGATGTMPYLDRRVDTIWGGVSGGVVIIEAKNYESCGALGVPTTEVRHMLVGRSCGHQMELPNLDDEGEQSDCQTAEDNSHADFALAS